MSVRLVAHQLGQFVPAFQQLLQAIQHLAVRIEEDPVGDLP